MTKFLSFLTLLLKILKRKKSVDEDLYIPKCFIKNEIHKVTDENQESVEEYHFKFNDDVNQIKNSILDILWETIYDIKKDIVGFRIDREESEPLKGIEKRDMQNAEDKVSEMITPRLVDCEKVINK